MALDSPTLLWQAVQSGTVTLLDVRPPQAFSQGHVPGAVSAPFSRSGWAQAVTTFLKGRSAGLALFADSEFLATAASDALTQVQVPVEGVYHAGVNGWTAAGLPIVAVQALTVDELRAKRADWTVIDVREPYEWRSGVVPGALRIPLGTLPERLAELDRNTPYALVCASGNRSQQAASFLADQGFKTANVVGGMSLWLGAGHPVEPAG